ncbi:MAG: tetratricopeptide repeat protein, partial [Lapillicoccus sp.]
APGARVHLGLGATGDRPDEAIEGLGEIAGKSADHIVLAHKPKYFRGRTLEDMDGHLRAGLSRVGVVEVESHPTELGGLQAILPALQPGDVLAFMSHEQQVETVGWLEAQWATPDDARTIRRKVVQARGEHEAEAEIAAIWALDDAQERVPLAQALSGSHPGDPRLVFEWASTLDAAGDEAAAAPLYRQALAGGLRQPHRHRAQLQAASSYRVLGELEGSLEMLDEVAPSHAAEPSVVAFRALTLAESGRTLEAVADLVDVLVDTASDDDTAAYRRALHAYAAQLRQGRG